MYQKFNWKKTDPNSHIAKHVLESKHNITHFYVEKKLIILYNNKIIYINFVLEDRIIYNKVRYIIIIIIF